MKSIIICGPQASGKTTIAKAIANVFKPEEVVITGPILKSGFECDSQKTKVIVFDEINETDDIIGINGMKKVFRDTLFIFTTQCEVAITEGEKEQFSLISLFQNRE